MTALPIPYRLVPFSDRRHVVGWSGRPICGADPDPGRKAADDQAEEKPNTCPACVAKLRGRGVLG